MLRSFILLIALFLSSLSFTQASEVQKELPKKKKSLKIPKYYTSPKISNRFQTLSYNKYYAPIPRGCIVYLPKLHKNKLGRFPGKGKLLNWKDFSSKNRSWIHTVALSKKQVFKAKNGKAYEFPYEKLESLKKLGRVIICTYKDTPVRVKIQKQPDQKK